jgi:hypothetical protein
VQATKRTAFKRVIATTAAAAVGVLSVFVVASAPAEATCGRGGVGITITRNYNGHAVAQERNIAGTCDGDGIYNGQLRDPYNDGYAARAWYEDLPYEGIVVYSSGTWKNYRFYEQNNNGGSSAAILQIYSSPMSRPNFWWGTYDF